MDQKMYNDAPFESLPSQSLQPIYDEATTHQAQMSSRSASGAVQSMDQPPPYSTEYGLSSEAVSSVPSTANSMLSTQRTSSSSVLHKVIAIPSTTPKLGSPFLRAYPPVLEQYNLSREPFLGFIDELNRAIVASPPLQVLGAAGSLVGFVPLATAQIVGNAVSAAATVGTVAVSKGRMELFMRDSNRTIFAPRRLKIDIVKMEALANATNMPVLTSSGKIDKTASLLQPIEDEDASVTGQQRRLNALKPYIAELDLEPLPQVANPDNPLSKWSAGASERQRTKQEAKMVEKRQEGQEKYVKESAKAQKEYEKEMTKLDKEEDKVRRKEKGKKLQEDLEKVEKERRKKQKEFDKKTGEVEKDRMKDDKEEGYMRKILWLMITDLDESSTATANY